MAGETIAVKILNPSGSLFEGECEVVFVPVEGGQELALLPHHTPLIALVGKGDVRIKQQGGIKLISKAERGILHVSENEAEVLINA